MISSTKANCPFLIHSKHGWKVLNSGFSFDIRCSLQFLSKRSERNKKLVKNKIYIIKVEETIKLYQILVVTWKKNCEFSCYSYTYCYSYSYSLISLLKKLFKSTDLFKSYHDKIAEKHSFEIHENYVFHILSYCGFTVQVLELVEP